MKAWAPAAVILLATACAKLKPGDIPFVRYGSDACARCGMIVSEERFASGYVDGEGKSVVFDDLGEFLQDAAAHPEVLAIAFVHDAETGLWLRADQALLVKAPGLATPMGSGLAALSSVERAAAFARRLGGMAKVLTVQEATKNEKSGG